MLTNKIFADHYVDHRNSCADNLIFERLHANGLVLIDFLTSRQAVLDFARRVMEIAAHRDSDPDGLTTIHDTRRHAQQAGFAGFGNGALLAHTESSSVPHPPKLMLLACQRAAGSGGEILLADGQAIYAELAERWPEAADALSQPGTAFYGDGGGHPARVFTPYPDGRIALRLRQDRLARFSPLVTRHLPRLYKVIDAHQHPVALSPGQGYLVDNERWLHARKAFSGHRRCLRALGAPTSPLQVGFAAGAVAGWTASEGTVG
ncbi:TauD/TfdA family dioxygenase [Streptomyces sp. Edi2]|uniref:TauD/TfdA family dioxygenase n=1 Tax=Streptomyces sp. Edi2 TaxID=3162528 RepID=UPI0033058BDA